MPLGASSAAADAADVAVLAWAAPVPQTNALPYGWTDAAVATAGEMADALHLDPLGMLALFMSESGCQPHIKPAGLAGFTPIIESEMHWPHGTIAQLVAGDPVYQLQAIYALWCHNQEHYVGMSFADKAKQWGVPVEVVLYCYHGFLAGSMRATGPSSILADAITDVGQTYSGNLGLDPHKNGNIKVQDIMDRLARMRKAVQNDPKVSVIWHRLQSIASLPGSSVPTLGDFFGAARSAWRTLTGSDVRIDPTPGAHGSASTGNPAPIGAQTGGGGSTGSGSGSTALLLLAAGTAAFALWKARVFG